MKDHRKNRASHSSQRNGLTKIMARIPFSMIPLRLWHCGQLIITILRTLHRHPNSQAILCCKGLHFCPVLYSDF
jgi:hypothetical protein